MAVLAIELMPPNGPLTPQLFPGLETRDVAAKITGYIAAALADPRIAALTPEETQDISVRPFVRWMFFREVWIEMSSKPASVTIAERGSSAFLIQQIQNIEKLMNDALDEFEGTLPDVGVEQLFPETMSIKTNVTWYAGTSAP